MKVYVIRHGETSANVEGVFQGRLDTELLESGRQLARLVGKALCDVRFDAAFTSPLSRAQETARILLDESGNFDVSSVLDERLYELSMGDCEGKRFQADKGEIDERYLRDFFNDPLHFDGFPGGESTRAACARTSGFLYELIKQPYETVLVSTHGFALRAMLNTLYDNPADFWHGGVPLNCSVSIIKASCGELKLIGDDVVLYGNNLVRNWFA